jgi:hypothetical protein
MREASPVLGTKIKNSREVDFIFVAQDMGRGSEKREFLRGGEQRSVRNRVVPKTAVNNSELRLFRVQIKKGHRGVSFFSY